MRHRRIGTSRVAAFVAFRWSGRDKPPQAMNNPPWCVMKVSISPRRTWTSEMAMFGSEEAHRQRKEAARELRAERERLEEELGVKADDSAAFGAVAEPGNHR